MKLEGVVKSGRLVIDPAVWAICMREYEGQPVTVEIDKKRDRRTVRANARYWGVIIPLARHCLNLKRPGLLPLTKEQVHGLLVTAFAGSEVTELGTIPVATRTMDTKQFHHLTEQAELWLGEQGYGVPDGPEVSIAAAIAEAMA